MAMTSDDLIHHMACDFAQWVHELVPGWDRELQPAESFTDTVCSAFGDAPTEESIVDAYKTGAAARAVREHMTWCWETDLVTDAAAKALVERTIVNNLGKEALQ